MDKSRIKLNLLFVLLFVACLLPGVNSRAAVRLNKKKVTIVKGETVKLKVKGTKKKVKWSSSNKYVASVNKNGLVRGKKGGYTAKITAKVKKKKYKCAVKVVNVTCDAVVTATTSGALIAGESKSILDFSLSRKVKTLEVGVYNAKTGSEVNYFELDSGKSGRVEWDLKQSNGEYVSQGKFYYIIYASGCEFETESFEVKEIELTCNTTLSTSDGGELICMKDTSQSVLEITLSKVVEKMIINVYNSKDKIVRSYSYGNVSYGKVVWDLKDDDGSYVSAGEYYYGVVISDKKFTSQRFSIIDLNNMELTCETNISTLDGGDLIVGMEGCKSVLDITLSVKVNNLTVDVCDAIGNVIKTFTLAPGNTGRVEWDLKNAAGESVGVGEYYYVVHVLGKKFSSDYFGIFDGSDFASGTGSAQNPYEVTNYEQLKKIIYHGSCHFIQTCDIDVNFENYNSLFSEDVPFTGTYDGGNYSIKNIVVNTTGADYIGLFSAIGETGVVKNLKVEECTFIAYCYVGAIAGTNGGTISNCTVTNVDVQGKNHVAGICGENTGTISNCTITNVDVQGNTNYAAGICGENTGVVDGCSVSDGVLITVKGGYAGGIVAFNGEAGKVTNCMVNNSEVVYEEAAIGDFGAGGIAGKNMGTMQNCTVTNNTVKVVLLYTITSWNVYLKSAGLAGDNRGTINTCTVSGNTILCSAFFGGSSSKEICYIYLGAATGYNTGIISNITITDNEFDGKYSRTAGTIYLECGGVTGYNSGSVSSNDVTSQQYNYSGTIITQYEGSIIGYNDGTCSRNVTDNGTLNQVGGPN